MTSLSVSSISQFQKRRDGQTANIQKSITKVSGSSNSSSGGSTDLSKYYKKVSDVFITSLGITVGNSIFKSNYLGVATNNPSYTLDVSGDINFTGTLLQNGEEFSSNKEGLWATDDNGINYTGHTGVGGDSSADYMINVLGDVNFTGTLYQNGEKFTTPFEADLSQVFRVSGQEDGFTSGSGLTMYYNGTACFIRATTSKEDGSYKDNSVLNIHGSTVNLKSATSGNVYRNISLQYNKTIINPDAKSMQFLLYGSLGTALTGNYYGAMTAYQPWTFKCYNEQEGISIFTKDNAGDLFKLTHTTPSTDIYMINSILDIDDVETEVFSVRSNGDVHVTGALYQNDVEYNLADLLSRIESLENA